LGVDCAEPRLCRRRGHRWYPVLWRPPFLAQRGFALSERLEIVLAWCDLYRASAPRGAGNRFAGRKLPDWVNGRRHLRWCS
jgi:hypothetical protein